MTPGSPETTLAVVGSYAASDSAGIHALTFASDLGLRVIDTWSGVSNPSFLIRHPHGPYLYAVSETSPGTVHAFRIDGVDGQMELSPLNHQPSAGDHPCHLSVDESGRCLAASNYGSGSVTLFPIEPDGNLGEPSASVRHSGSGPHPRQEAPHAHASVFSPDGRFLLTADLGTDQVVVYALDRDAGSLARTGAAQTGPGAGPRHLVFHPDGRHLFVVNELDNTVSLMDWDGGEIQTLQTQSTLPDPAPHSLAADIHVSADGDHVYVSNRGHDSLAVFSFNPAAGLNLMAIRPCGGVTPRGFRLAPDGRHLWVANQQSGEIVVMPLLDEGGDIGQPIAHVAVPHASCVTFLEGRA